MSAQVCLGCGNAFRDPEEFWDHGCLGQDMINVPALGLQHVCLNSPCNNAVEKANMICISCADLAEAADLKTFPSGAVRRDIDDQRYDLISPWGLMRLAKRYALGAKRYEPRQWEKGMPEGDIINHMDKHFTLYKQGDRSDDHIAALAWGAFAMLHFDELEKQPQALKDSPPTGRHKR